MSRNELLKKAKELLNIEATAVNRAADLLDENFCEAIDLIRQTLSKNKKIVFMGMGKSHYVAAKLAASFMSTGMNSLFVHPAEAVHGDLGIIHPDDVCILISKSGATSEILGLLPFLKERNPIIAIIGNKHSPIAKQAQVILDASIEQEACPINMLPTASTTVALALGDALVSVFAEEKGFSKERFKGYHPGGSIGKRLNKYVKDVMLSMVDIPFGNGSEVLKLVAQKMNNQPVGAFCVVDHEMKLEGILVEGDLRRAVAKNTPLETPIKDIMIQDPVVLEAHLLIDEAIALMERKEKQITSAPVLNSKNQLIGYVRIHDLL